MEYRRLSGAPFEWLHEQDPGAPPVSYSGGSADLTPIRNKAREAMDALVDAQKAADSGKVDDAMEAMRRAKSAIEIALGGQIGFGSTSTGAAPVGMGGSPGQTGPGGFGR